MFDVYLIFTVCDSIFSFHYVFMCVFIIPVGRNAILLECAIMDARTGDSNTKYYYEIQLFWH